ncbi:MAG: META domain-containing protein [Ferruginibacter sp.]
MKYVPVILSAFVLFSCSPKMSADASWGNQHFFVVEMKGVPVQQSGGRRDAFLAFRVAEKKFSGNAGCNQINGNYTIDKSSIHFGEVLSTKMSCEDIEFENVFLSTLSGIDHFEMRGSDLLLKHRKDVMLVLRPR